jgi:hypothetical protein
MFQVIIAIAILAASNFDTNEKSLVIMESCLDSVNALIEYNIIENSIIEDLNQYKIDLCIEILDSPLIEQELYNEELINR